ncbi:MAG TPA: SigE family RNA polymerase sigma factor [Streptosporangiaceae bacterium]
MKAKPAGLIRLDDVPLDDPGPADADELVSVLYREHATDLIRCAVVILGDRGMAEDVVQEAFCGLYRRWGSLSDRAKALTYVRSAVLNRCRTVLRSRARRSRIGLSSMTPPAPSAEHEALIGEEHRAVLAGLRRLPPRQREALALRFLADLDELEIAELMGISQGTVKSTVSRGITALGKQLGGASE